jgi:anti-sigma factor RsiW
MMHERATHLTPIDLDMLRLKLGGADDRAALDAHLAACPACARQQAEYQRHAAHFDKTIYPRTLPTVRRRLGTSRRAPILALTAAAAAAIVVMAVRPRHQQSAADPSAIGVKGPGVLQVFARR